MPRTFPPGGALTPNITGPKGGKYAPLFEACQKPRYTTRPREPGPAPAGPG
jgi:hypothetical protein